MNNRRITMLTTLSLSAALGAGCGSGPTKEQCEELARHVAKLLVTDKTSEDTSEYIEKISSAIAPEYVERCQEKGKRSEIDCLMAAEDLEALQECSPKR